MGLFALAGAAVAVLRLVFLSVPIGLAVAAGAGALAYYALDRWYELREDRRARPPMRPALEGRARELGIAPSFEVYDPRPAGRTAPKREPDDP